MTQKDRISLTIAGVLLVLTVWSYVLKLSGKSEIVPLQEMIQEESECLSEPTSECLFAMAEAVINHPETPYPELAKSWLAENFAEAGEFDRALEIATQIEDSDDRSVALRRVAEKFADQGDFSQALEITDRFRRNRIQYPDALAHISVAQAERGLFAEALATAAKVRDEFLYPSEAADATRGKAFALIAAAQSDAGHFDDARSTAEGIYPIEEKAMAFRWIAEDLASAGLAEQALETLARARQVARRIRPRDDAFVDAMGPIAVIYANLDSSLADEVFEEITSRVQVLSSDQFRAESWAKLAGHLKAAGRERDAEDMAELAVNTGTDLRRIAIRLAKAGFYEHRLNAAHKMKLSTDRAHALDSIAGDLYLAGRVEASRDAYSEAVSIALVLSDPKDRDEALKRIISSQTKYASMFDAALKNAEHLAAGEDKEWAFLYISRNAARHGEIALAISCLDEIQDGLRLSSALGRIAVAISRGAE